MVGHGLARSVLGAIGSLVGNSGKGSPSVADLASGDRDTFSRRSTRLGVVLKNIGFSVRDLAIAIVGGLVVLVGSTLVGDSGISGLSLGVGAAAKAPPAIVAYGGITAGPCNSLSHSLVSLRNASIVDCPITVRPGANGIKSAAILRGNVEEKPGGPGAVYVVCFDLSGPAALGITTESSWSTFDASPSDPLQIPGRRARADPIQFFCPADHNDAWYLLATESFTSAAASFIFVR